ncbi:DUF465 domain-containing protein [Novosphingobium sp.]|uniref:DUF465 domain-containing protein n=1 Tax=Novosphingobium sp. TaxID=1874826 RepID=UPI003BAB7165
MHAQDYRLSLVHHRLETEIGREQARKAPDRWRLIRLKKLKLAIKDRLHRLTGATA